MKTIIKEALSREQFKERPPVLVDLGASGSLPRKWELIAPYSICLALDADQREFRVEESHNENYKKQIRINRLITAEESQKTEFYLTRSPYCSSTLKPNLQKLQPWAFRDLFAVESTVELPATTIKTILDKCGLYYIDWYKTDTQGIDLKIFNSLPEEIKKKIISADFEPGIIDAYDNEDKLCDVMDALENADFWISNMDIKGSQWILESDLKSISPSNSKKIENHLRTAPGWCEISYFNKFNNQMLGIREHILGWIFATIEGHHGFAIYIASQGEKRFDDSFFRVLKKSSISRLSSPTRLLNGIILNAVKKFDRYLTNTL